MMWAQARGALRKIRGEREGERRSEKLGVSARESGAHKSYWARNTLDFWFSYRIYKLFKYIKYTLDISQNNGKKVKYGKDQKLFYS